MANAQNGIQNANRLAEEKSRELVPHLKDCLESIKEYIGDEKKAPCSGMDYADSLEDMYLNYL